MSAVMGVWALALMATNCYTYTDGHSLLHESAPSPHRYEEVTLKAETRQRTRDILNTMRQPGLALGFGRWRDRWALRAKLNRHSELAAEEAKEKSLAQRFAEVSATVMHALI
jgi:hypothetical protein